MGFIIKNIQYSHNFLVQFVALCLLAFSCVTANAETVPIPQERPAVLSASPEYIKALMSRDENSGVFDDNSLNNITPSAHTENMGNTEYEYEYEALPLPEHKPNNEHDEDMTADIQGDAIEDNPSSALPETEAAKEEAQKTMLISVAFADNQIALDDESKSFLLKHAVKMFKSDPDLVMEIQAYASKENNQEYSDVRRSLARALDVRSFLLKQDVEPLRIKLTPFGQDKGNSSDNRVDLVFMTSQ